MALLTKTAKNKTTLVVLREPVTTPDGTMLPDIYELVNGEIRDLPSQMREAIDPFDGPRPFSVRVLDVQKFVRDLANHAKRAAAPAAPLKLTRAELQREYNLSEDVFSLAEPYGFPRAMGYRLQGGRQVPLHRAEHVEQWIKGLRELVRLVGIR